MTDIAIETVLDTILVQPITCEDRTGCARPATWRGVRHHLDGSSCQHRHACDEHKAKADANFAQWLDYLGRRPYLCKSHLAPVTTIRWRPL